MKYILSTMLFLAVAATCFAEFRTQDSKLQTIHLDELDVATYMLQDWGAPQVNKNVLWGKLSVNGVQYSRGVGTHSISRLLLRLDGKASRISGLAGSDDQNDYSGKMVFKILADRKQLWSSGVMQKGMAAKRFDLKLKGVKQIVLMVEEAGDGIMYDHADWLDVKIETTGVVVAERVVPKPIAVDKYVLTPKAPAVPRINSPKVFGVRPGSPFLYTIAATGEAPVKYTAYQMPDGLSLDEKTGFITGSIAGRGTYYMVVRADNALGGDSRVVRIEVGDRIALTPPMGWNSWNCWGASVDEQKVKDAAGFMSRELIHHGWSYINIDDGWEAKQRTADGILAGNDKFPDFKGLSKYIHAKGLKFGIYSSPGPKTCGGYPGSYRHERIDAETWAAWGVDYLKYDYCHYSEVAPKPTEALIREPYDVMRKALDEVKRDIVYCVGYGAPNVWHWAKSAGGNQWRTTRDITDEWNVVSAIGFFQDVCAEATAPGSYNDPDMLVVGTLGLGWGAKAHDSYLTPHEQYAHIALWCILSAPLLIGCDMNRMDDFTFNLLTNDEVLAIDQDPAAMPAHKIITDNGQIWWKALDDGSFAVGFFNADPYFILWEQSQAEAIQQRRYPFKLNANTLGIKGQFTVRDLWRQKELGVFENSFSTETEYHGVSFVKITPLNNE